MEDENRQEHFNDIYRWQKICVAAANMIATSHYVQENIKDLFFLEDGTKKKLADIKKDEDGILTMSSAGTTYQLLSKKFKGEAPMAMLSGLNAIIQKTYKKETIDIKNGKKSLRTYRDNIPMPLPSQQIRNVEQQPNGNFKFMAYGKNFVTAFGRDRSNNKVIMERAVSGKYKLCDSSIQLKDKEMFLLAVFQFESEEKKVDETKLMYAELSPSIPIIAVREDGFYTKIGSAEEFLHRRIQIQEALKRSMIAAKYNNGGKGRKKKMKSIDRYQDKEKNYVQTKLHTYSRQLINHCVKNSCGKLILANLKPKSKDVKEMPNLLRNWSYYGLKTFIEYKAKQNNIQVEYADLEYNPEILEAENGLLTQILTIQN